MNKPNRQASQTDTKPDSQEVSPQSELSPPLIGPENDTEISADHNQYSDKEGTPTNKVRWKAKIKEISMTDHIVAWATIVIAIATTIYTAISVGQWRFMGQQTTAAFRQLSTAKVGIRIANDTLIDARNSGIEQSDRMSKLVKANERISQATIRAANVAKESADIAKAALVAGNRAWVKLNGAPEIVSPLEFDETGQGQIGIRFNLKNVGHSPALSVWVEAVCVADISLFMWQHKRDPRDNPVCKALRTRTWDFGSTIFPNEPTYFVGNNLLIIQKKEIAERITRLESEGKADSDYIWKIAPIIYGCIDYVLPEDGNRHHQTGFIYNLYGRDSVNSPTHRMIDTRNRSTPIEQLWLDNYFGSGIYAD